MGRQVIPKLIGFRYRVISISGKTTAAVTNVCDIGVPDLPGLCRKSQLS